MNKYGARLMRQWQTADPERFAQIPDPEEFFTQMGADLEERIDATGASDRGARPARRGLFGEGGAADVGQGQRGERPDPGGDDPGAGRGDRGAAAGGVALDLDARPGVRDRPGLRFTPAVGDEQLPPSGARGRARANLEAIRLLQLLAEQERDATDTECAQLARWSGWGAVAELFDEQRQEWQHDREQLRALVGEDGYAQARRTTINAHYTHPAIAAAMWQLVGELGFAGGEVIEPGCGAGVFIGLAPKDARMVGVELDATTAHIAEQLYPHAKIVNRSFAEPARGLREGRFALAIGNVPFGKVTLYDPEHNRSGHAIHNLFIVKSPALVQPVGLAVLLTPLHARRRQPGSAAGDEPARRPVGRGAAAERRPSPRRRYRRGDRPARVPPPAGRQRAVG